MSESQSSFWHGIYIVNETPEKINIFQIWNIAWEEEGLLNAEATEISREKYVFLSFIFDRTEHVQIVECTLFFFLSGWILWSSNSDFF